MRDEVPAPVWHCIIANRRCRSGAAEDFYRGLISSLPLRIIRAGRSIIGEGSIPAYIAVSPIVSLAAIAISLVVAFAVFLRPRRLFFFLRVPEVLPIFRLGGPKAIFCLASHPYWRTKGENCLRPASNNRKRLEDR